MYTLPLRLPPQVFVGTSVVFFAITNVVKLVPYFFLGQFDAANLETSAVLFPLAAITTVIGIWIVKKIDQKVFYGISYVTIFLIGLKLVYDGTRALL